MSNMKLADKIIEAFNTERKECDYINKDGVCFIKKKYRKTGFFLPQTPDEPEEETDGEETTVEPSGETTV